MKAILAPSRFYLEKVGVIAPLKTEETEAGNRGRERPAPGHQEVAEAEPDTGSDVTQHAVSLNKDRIFHQTEPVPFTRNFSSYEYAINSLAQERMHFACNLVGETAHRKIHSSGFQRNLFVFCLPVCF